MDEFNTEPQNIETTPPTQGTNRRNFLKVAVVSSAAAAAAVGGAGAAAAALSSGRGSSTLSKLLVLDNYVSTDHACWTNTTYQEESSYNSNESMYFWAWFSLPTHSATDQFTVSLVSPASLPATIGAGSIDYQSGGNNIFVYPDLSGCPSSDPSKSATPITGGTLPFGFTTAASTNSVLIAVHLKVAGATGSFSMTVNLSGPNSFSENATQTATFA